MAQRGDRGSIYQLPRRTGVTVPSSGKSLDTIGSILDTILDTIKVNCGRGTNLNQSHSALLGAPKNRD